MRLISALIEEYDLKRFFTLTLRRSIIPKEQDPWEYIHHPWSKFRKRMNRRFASFKFVAVLEAHKNNEYPHIHGFTNVWMHQRNWSTMWSECKGGDIVWVEKVADLQLSEYVSKSLEVARYVGKEQLLDAYKQRKRHRTLWRSENTKAKFELNTSSEWCIIQEKVYNENGEMLDYFSKKGVWSGSQAKCKRENLEGTRSALPEKSTETSVQDMEAEKPKDKYQKSAVPS